MKDKRSHEMLSRPLGRVEKAKPDYAFSEFLVDFGKALGIVIILGLVVLVFVRLITR